MRAAAATLVAVLLTAPSWARAQVPAAEDVLRPVAELVIEAMQEALRDDGKAAERSLTRAAAFHPRAADVDVVRGMVRLHLGLRAQARRDLPERGRWAAYRAMAEAGERGGLGRARSVLARAAEAPDADAATLFLAALAFADAGQPDRADALLARAVKRADGALDDALGPAPAQGLAEAVQVALRDLIPDDEATVRAAEVLIAAGHRGVGLGLLRRLPTSKQWRLRALVARLDALRAVAPEAARVAAQAVLEVDAAHPAARLALAELAVAEGDLADARRQLEGVTFTEGPARSRAGRVRARLALADKEGQAAFRAAKEAVLADPKSHEARALLARSLLMTGSVEQAAEVAEDLLRKAPTEVDPFGLLADVRAAQGRTRQVEALELRSQGFRRERAKQTALRASVEEVLDAVRSAEGGLGVAGLGGLRARDPRLGLPIDLALARAAAPGVARVARDRVLAACVPHFGALLTRSGVSAETAATVSLYGQPQALAVPLSATDPFRCRPGALRVGDSPRRGHR